MQILTLIVVFANNILKLNQTKDRLRPKYLFLVATAASCVTRGISLLLIMEQAEGIWLEVLYTGPILLWITSLVIFVAHLGGCCMILQKKETNLINSILVWVPPCLRIESSYPVIFYVYFITKSNFLHSIILLSIILYTMIILASMYFSNKLIIELDEAIWMVPFLERMRKLVLVVSGFLTLRIVLLIWMYTNHVTLNNGLNLLLVDIFLGEIAPYAALIYVRLPIPRQGQSNAKEIELKSVQVPLLS